MMKRKAIFSFRVFLLTLLTLIFTAPEGEVMAQNRRQEVRKTRRKSRRVTRRVVRRTNRRIVRRVNRRAVRAHYRTLTPYRRVVTVVPTGHRVIVVRGRNYYFHRGVYYVKVTNGYRTVVGPRGARVVSLPADYVNVVQLNNRTYHYYYGTFYTKVDDGYEVTAPPAGAVVDDIPQGYEVVSEDDKEYYKIEDMYFEKVENEGEEAFELVKTA